MVGLASGPWVCAELDQSYRGFHVNIREALFAFNRDDAGFRGAAFSRSILHCGSPGVPTL